MQSLNLELARSRIEELLLVVLELSLVLAHIAVKSAEFLSVSESSHAKAIGQEGWHDGPEEGTARGSYVIVVRLGQKVIPLCGIN